MAGSEDTLRDTAGLEALISRAAAPGRGLPPVDKWNPDFCGDLDMEIKADGTWFYMGTPIGRLPLVRLFSTVLRKDADGRTYLVTPVEKVGIRVEDAPFLGVELDVSGEGHARVMTLRTNVGDIVEVGADNPLRFVIDKVNAEIKAIAQDEPYRKRMEALFIEPTSNTPDEFGALIKSESARFGEVISKANIKVE